MNDDKLMALERLRIRCAKQQEAWKNDQIEVGEFTYGRPTVHIWDDKTKLKIGKFCSIGGNVQILLGGEHHTDWCSTYPFNVFLADAYGFEERIAASKGDVVIGNDVWICDNVLILSGVTIGDGAVIGAGAVVTKNVQPYDIVGGNPARHIGWRLGDIHRSCLTWRTEWWNWPLDKLVEAIPVIESGDLGKLMELDWRWPYWQSRFSL